jgi:hypothetical protein
MNKKRITAYVLILIFMVFTLVHAMPNTSADTTTGFILASAGKDGQFGTNDDVAATASQPAVKGNPANISVVDAIPSANKAAKDEPKPLRQPNSDEIVIRTPEELAKIGTDPNYSLNGKYILMADLDLSSYTNWQPIGNSSAPFSGQFDGNGFVIKNLTINRPNELYQGLFGYINSTGAITNLTLENVGVTGLAYVGSLAGANLGTITKVYSTCSVKVTRTSSVSPAGGLVGLNKGTIINGYVSGNVSGYDNTGGLAGRQEYGTISDSSSGCDVTGTYSTGGLVGGNFYGPIKRSYATGKIISTSYYFTGGLVGENYYGTIEDSYATGSVKNNYYYSLTGGLVGKNTSGTIKNSYSTGSVSGYAYVGGLVGYNAGSVINGYWDIQTSGLTTSAGGTGKTTAQMKAQATFVNWDFTNVWAIDEGKSYPYLRTNEQIPHPGTN